MQTEGSSLAEGERAQSPPPSKAGKTRVILTPHFVPSVLQHPAGATAPSGDNGHEKSQENAESEEG